MLFAMNRRNIFLAIVWLAVAINFVYFFRRTMLSDYCNIDQLIKKKSSSKFIVADRPGESVTAKISEASVSKGEQEAVVDNGDEFERCETMTSGQSLTTAAAADGDNGSHRPPWCMYKDQVDLRIIVLTFNRHASLLKLLNSINDLELDGDSVAIEIWIDRDRKTNTVDEKTVSTARSFQWRHGTVGVHVRRRHAGIYGQWIDTWRPRNASTSEMALIVEDDLSLSPYAYRWLRAARRFYVDRRDDIAGLTLQSEGLIVATNHRPLVRPAAAGGASFLYALMGSWGFAPTPSVWIAFQDWFHEVRSKPGFKPYVQGLIMTSWYKDFEKSGKADSMWTIWFLHYCAVVRQLFTVYNNVPAVAEKLQLQADINRGYLTVNRREPGLHFVGKAANNTNLLLTTWNKEFVNFHVDAPVLGFDGKLIKGGSSLLGGR